MSTGLSSFSALYLHVPFCVRRCRYCDFTTSAIAHDDPLVEGYVEALVALLERLGSHGLFAGVETAYVGGGTPTMAGAALPRLVLATRRACGAGLREFSSEANPESLDADLARSLAAADLTRLSLGVQSLDDAELARLGRAHDARRAHVAMASARAAGLDLSCDLMCGIPLQTRESWEASLRGVVDAGATHVSCYPLMVEEGTPLYDACEAGEEAWPDDDAQADLMLIAERVLGSAGMSRYEVASYALPGHACRHNIAYWTGRSYLGLGTGASSMMTPAQFAALADALLLACVPEGADSPDEGGPGEEGLWGEEEGQPLGSGAALGGCELAARMRAAGEQHVARVRVRLLDGPRQLLAAMTNHAPLLASVETLSLREALAEDLMLGMRMSAGVSPGLVARSREVMGRALDDALGRMVARGLARRTAQGGAAPTESGWLLGNELYGEMWGLA